MLVMGGPGGGGEIGVVAKQQKVWLEQGMGGAWETRPRLRVQGRIR